MPTEPRYARRLARGVLLVLGVCTSWVASADSLPGPLLLAKEVPLTPEIRALAPGRVERAESIDFTGDGAPDLILSVALGPEEEVRNKAFAFRELWVDSGGALLRSKLVYRTPIAERWFANFDDDPELEIVTVFGYEDGVDFALVDQTRELAEEEEKHLKIRN